MHVPQSLFLVPLLPTIAMKKFCYFLKYYFSLWYILKIEQSTYYFLSLLYYHNHLLNLAHIRDIPFIIENKHRAAYK